MTNEAKLHEDITKGTVQHIKDMLYDIPSAFVKEMGGNYMGRSLHKIQSLLDEGYPEEARAKADRDWTYALAIRDAWMAFGCYLEKK